MASSAKLCVKCHEMKATHEEPFCRTCHDGRIGNKFYRIKRAKCSLCDKEERWTNQSKMIYERCGFALQPLSSYHRTLMLPVHYRIVFCRGKNGAVGIFEEDIFNIEYKHFICWSCKGDEQPVEHEYEHAKKKGRKQKSRDAQDRQQDYPIDK